jgi:NAD(P)-dependent dehydrogenase (short-subunit alcohol dehydrogenase family)
LDKSKIFDLTGKVAIVTGAASGIGRCIALRLAQFGANIVIADVSTQGLEVVDEVKSLGRQALFVKTDITSNNEVEQMVTETVDKFGKVDILVNNAGISPKGSVADTEEKDWDRALNVNLKGAFFCSKAVIKHMKKQRSGKIVSISSIAGKTGGWLAGPQYSVSKAGIECLTKRMARELAPYQINCNCIAPHAIDSPGIMKEAIDSYIKGNTFPVLLGRIGKPDDVANLALFLVCDASNYITGQTINLNGGALML